MLSLKIDRKKLLLTGLLLITLLFCVNVKADASWVKNSNGTYSWYTSKGKLAKNKWIKKNYYVDSDGVRVTGLQKIGSKYYFFSKNTGELIRSTWIKSGSKYYYAKGNGVLYRNGRYQINGYYYYFGKTCRRLTGLRKVRGRYMYFDVNSGRMITKAWAKVDGKYYYFKKNGVMKKSAWVGKRYVGSDGAALTGLQQISGKYYYFDSSTLKKVTNTTKTVNGVTYEFNSDGVGTVKSDSSSRPASSWKMEPTYYTDPYVSDEVLLSAIIACESGGEVYEGQLAVGYVIMNRVSSSSFPNSIAEVVYQSGQFSPVEGSGSTLLTQKLKSQSSIPANSTKAAKEVLSSYKSGTTPKLTYDGKTISFPYLFFCTPDAYKRCGLTSDYFKLGGHVFFMNWK